MVSRISLKLKMALGIGIVMLPVILAFMMFSLLFLSKTNDRIIDALESQYRANAKAIGTEIAFEVAASETEDLATKISHFLEEQKGTNSISIVSKDDKLLAEVGNKVGIHDLLLAIKEDGSARTGELVIVAEPIKMDEDSGIVGYVVSSVSLQDFMRFQRLWVWGQAGLSAFGLLIIISGSLFVGHRMTRPINLLVSAAQRITDGDLESIEIEVKGSLEIQRLSDSIKAMAKALQTQVTTIKAITKDVSGVSKEVAGAMSHMASSAIEQAAAVTETATTVEEMEMAGKSAAGNAGLIVSAAEKTTEASIRGKTAVESTNDIILVIKSNSQEISEKSRKLLGAIEEVGNIIGSVNNIAEQSKILAVNASIEAAKAGEYGAGFAVVAQEVRDLAQQSKDATLQITDTLTSIMRAIENMVKTAQSGEEHTDEGVKIISNVGTNMGDLSEAIHENSNFANMIATNIKQQSIGLTQIASAIEEINSTALENQDVSTKLERSTRMMTESVDHLQSLVDKWRTPDVDIIDTDEFSLD